MKTAKKWVTLTVLFVVLCFTMFPTSALAAEEHLQIDDVQVQQLAVDRFAIQLTATGFAEEGYFIDVEAPNYLVASVGSIESGGIFSGWEAHMEDAFAEGVDYTVTEKSIQLKPGQEPQAFVFGFAYVPHLGGADEETVVKLMQHKLPIRYIKTAEKEITDTLRGYEEESAEQLEAHIERQYVEASNKIRNQGYSVDALKEHVYTGESAQAVENVSGLPQEYWDELEELRREDPELYEEFYDELMDTLGIENTSEAELHPEVETRLRRDEQDLLQEYLQDRADSFITDRFHTDIVVNEDGSYDVTETIDVTFLEPKHGLKRNISQQGSVIVPEGDSLREWKYNVRVSNVEVENWKYKKDSFSFPGEYGDVNIKIGDENLYVTGKQRYVIRYSCKLPRDPFEDMDLMYHYLFPDRWEEPIAEATATIHMPKRVQAENVQVRFEEERAQQKNGADINVRGRDITISLKAPLDQRNGVILDIKLPEGYYEFSNRQAILDALMENAELKDSDLKLVGMVSNIIGRNLYAREAVFLYICVLVMLISVVVWLCTGLNVRNPMVTVEVSPPDGMNPAEVGYVIDGCVDARDISGLIISWAGKGCIKIEPSNHQKNVFKLTKVAKLPLVSRTYEHGIFNALFAYGNSIYSNEFKKNVALKRALQTAATNIASQYWQTKAGTTLTKENSIYLSSNGRTAKGLRIWALILQVIALMIMIWQEPIAISAVAGYVWFFIFYQFATKSCVHSAMKFSSKFSEMFPRALLVGVMSFALPAIMGKIIYDSLFYAGMSTIACLVLVIMAGNCKKRTAYGNQLYGRILGYRRYIETVEHQKAVYMAKEDPSSVYEVLAYAYVLEITRVWVKHFETFDMPTISVVAYDMDVTTAVFHSMLQFSFVSFGSSGSDTHHNSWSDSGSSSSSGGDSGGGGGASGGGGGGAW